MYPVFTRMPGSVQWAIQCCVPYLSSAINSLCLLILPGTMTSTFVRHQLHRSSGPITTQTPLATKTTTKGDPLPKDQAVARALWLKNKVSGEKK